MQHTVHLEHGVYHDVSTCQLPG